MVAHIIPIIEEKLKVGNIFLWTLKYNKLTIFNNEKPISTNGITWVIFNIK
tara:strand:- start:3033 stop:3185 length:153 start_codon:yes stop_codon:yes gene_type:complete